MNLKNLLAASLALFLFLCPANAQESPSEEVPGWVQIHTPGEAHRKMDIFEGTWKTSMRIWMAGPDQEPNVSKGQSTFQWILDGRFMEEKAESNMSLPSDDGKMVAVPFAGRGVLGYDNVRKQYVNTWMDTLGTHIAYNKGHLSADGKTLTLYGEMDEPAQGIYGRWIRLQTTFETRDRHVFTMYDLHAGEDYKVMEVVYERLK